MCAVSYDDVVAVAARLESKPGVISLDPSKLAEVLADVTRLGGATDVADRAAALRRDLGRRLDAVREAVAGEPRPRVLALRGLDPPFIGGHWVPEMIEFAGGEDVPGSRERSRGLPAGMIAASRPTSSSRCPAWTLRRRDSRWSCIRARSRRREPADLGR